MIVSSRQWVQKQRKICCQRSQERSEELTAMRDSMDEDLFISCVHPTDRCGNISSQKQTMRLKACSTILYKYIRRMEI